MVKEHVCDEKAVLIHEVGVDTSSCRGRTRRSADLQQMNHPRKERTCTHFVDVYHPLVG